MVAFLTAPPEAFIPPELQGKHVVAVALCYAGPVEEGLKAVQPLKDFGTPAVDLVGPMPYVALQRMFDATAPRGIHSYWKTEYVSDLSADAARTLVDCAGRLGSPFSVVHVHHLEGAVKRTDEAATAFGRRGARYIVNVVGLWLDPGLQEAEIQWVRDSWQAVQPLATGGSSLNFMDGDEQVRLRDAYGANYERLVDVKTQHDPLNLFHINQNIAPRA